MASKKQDYSTVGTGTLDMAGARLDHVAAELHKFAAAITSNANWIKKTHITKPLEAHMLAAIAAVRKAEAEARRMRDEICDEIDNRPAPGAGPMIF